MHPDMSLETRPPAEPDKPKHFNRAAFQGDLKKLEKLYERPENKYFILHRSVGSELPIQAACRSKSHNSGRVVQQLIEWEKEFRCTEEYRTFLNSKKQKIKDTDPRRIDSRLFEKQQNGDIALQTACKFNNPGAVEALLDCSDELMRNQLLHGSGDLNNTVLHVAALENKEKILEIILNFYAEWTKEQRKLVQTSKNHNGDTPVHLAAQKGNLKILELFYKSNRECFKHCGRYNWTPLHTAVAYGQLEAVKTIVELLKYVIMNIKPDDSADKNPLLKPSVYKEDLQAYKMNKIDMSATDFDDDPDVTPLTLACMFGHTEIVEFLLEVGKPFENYIKAKAFKEAFIRKHTECMKLLVIWSRSSADLKDTFLSLSSQFEKEEATCQPCLRSANREPVEEVDHGRPVIPFSKGRYFFNALIQHMPDVAMYVLDKCVELRYEKTSPDTNNHEYSDLMSIKMTYDLIHPERIKEEQHPLKIMASKNKAELLKHPVVASFMFNRWNSAYGVFNILYWLIYLVFLVFTNVLIFTLPNPTSAHCVNGTANDTNKGKDSQPLPDSAYNAFAVLMLIITLIRLAIEAILVVKAVPQGKGTRNVLYYIDKIKKLDYLRDVANWILFLLTIIYSIMILNANNKSFCLSGPEWQVGVVLMCLSWIGMILESRDFQIIGVQAYTFWRVLKTLAKFIPFALFMFAAFGFSFYLLLYQYTIKGSPFASESYSFLSAYAMLAGDSSINDILGLDINAEARATPHPQYEVLTVIIWASSLLFITIILTNIMIGLAVENISEIYEVADFQKLKLQVDHITARHRNLMGWMKFQQEKEYKPNAISLFNILWKSVVFGIWGGSPFDSESAVNRVHSRLISWPEPNGNIKCVSKKAEAGAAVRPMSQNLLEQVDESEHTV